MSLRLADQLCFSLYAASRAVTAAYAPLLAPLGITYPQYLVMLVLWEKDGVTVKAIGEALALDSGTLTPLLKRLEAQGLVTRARSAADERALEVRLTAAGRRLEQRARSIPQALVRCLGLPPRELVRIREELRALARSASGSTRP